MSMRMKLTQKVDHFTVFNSFPSTSGSSRQITYKKFDGWTCEVVSGIFSLSGWQGMNWQERLQFKIVIGH